MNNGYLLSKLNAKTQNYGVLGGKVLLNWEDVAGALSNTPRVVEWYVGLFCLDHNTKDPVLIQLHKKHYFRVEMHLAGRVKQEMINAGFKPRRMSVDQFSRAIAKIVLRQHLVTKGECKSCRGLKRRLNSERNYEICSTCDGYGRDHYSLVERCLIGWPLAQDDGPHEPKTKDWYFKYGEPWEKYAFDELSKIQRLVDDRLEAMKRDAVKYA